MLCNTSPDFLSEDLMLQPCHVSVQIPSPITMSPGQIVPSPFFSDQGMLQPMQVVCREAQVEIHGWAVVFLPSLHHRQ